MIESLLDSLGGLGLIGLCLLAAALAFGETVILTDLVVPGEVGLVITGAAAAEAGEPLVPVILAGALGAALGDTVSYLVGRRWGRVLVYRFELTRKHLAPSLDRGEAFFDRHGGRAVFIGRWIGALRAVVPFVAGVSKLRFRTFVSWNVAASLSWAAVVVTLGHEFGRHIASGVDRVGTWVSVVAVVVLVVVWRVRRRATIS